MVISERTYHIVGQVPLDRLRLGSIIDSLHELELVNEGEELEFEQERLYCKHESLSEVKRVETVKGEAGIALKLPGVGGSGEASGGSKRDVDESYSSDGLDTLYFFPKRGDYEAAIQQSSGLLDFVRASNYAPVYMVTGLKIARQPKATSLTRVQDAQIGVSFGAEQAGLSLGPKLNAANSGTIMQSSGGMSDDYIFAVRVRKLCYRRRILGVLGPREWTDKKHNTGAELVGVDRESREKDCDEELDVEEIELGEEDMAGRAVEETDIGGERITWVFPAS